jgi:hypothetical protein
VLKANTGLLDQALPSIVYLRRHVSTRVFGAIEPLDLSPGLNSLPTTNLHLRRVLRPPTAASTRFPDALSPPHSNDHHFTPKLNTLVSPINTNRNSLFLSPPALDVDPSRPRSRVPQRATRATPTARGGSSPLRGPGSCSQKGRYSSYETTGQGAAAQLQRNTFHPAERPNGELRPSSCRE